VQSAKTNMNVDEVFFSIARDIKQRLADNDSKTEVFVLNFFPIASFSDYKLIDQCKSKSLVFKNTRFLFG